MTVKELIEKLREMPENIPVKLADSEYEPVECAEVYGPHPYGEPDEMPPWVLLV